MADSDIENQQRTAENPADYMGLKHPVKGKLKQQINLADENYPYTAMYLMLSGQLESGKIPELDGLSVKFNMITGSQWHLHTGNDTGVSQHAYKSMHSSDRVVWNFPFEMIYRMNDISGWPRVCVTMTSRDYMGNDVIAGYGIIHIPTQPGSHSRYVQIFRPKTSSYISTFIGWLTSRPAEYTNPIELLQKAQGREVTRVESVGIVKINVNVASRNMVKFGFQAD